MNSATRLGVQIFVGLLLGVPGTFVALVFAHGLLVHRYTWAEMDWNGDGHTSLEELLASVDVDTRLDSSDGMHCRVFFALKDGQPLRRICK